MSAHADDAGERSLAPTRHAAALPRRSIFARRTLIAWLLLAAALVAIAPAGYLLGERAAMQERSRSGEQQLAVVTLALQSELGRYEYLPAVFALNSDIVALLGAGPGDAGAARIDRVNRYLEEVNRGARTAAIYVLDVAGVVRAASNWNQPISFVGMDLSFRPYFGDAMAGGTGRFYGIGTTSGTPGYYFSRGITQDGRVIGVVAVKVDIDRIEATWSGTRDILMVTDADGVIVLASEPALKFRTLEALAPAVLERIRRVRQFDNAPLQPLDLREETRLAQDVRAVRLGTGGGEARRFLAMSRPLSDVGWRVTVLWDLASAEVYARYVALIAVLGGAVVGLALLYLMQRRRALRQRLAAKAALERAYDDLERKVVERTHDLTAANERLRLEAEQRQRNERVLRDAQDALVHASKMAVIGQMASGVAHELNQPLAALRTLSDNARVFLERGNPQAASGNLALIADLIERMGRITGELKTFGRKSAATLAPCDVAPVLDHALFLVDHRIKADGVRVRRTPRTVPQVAICEQERLGQVLVNLIANALDALKGRSAPELELDTTEEGGRVRIRVADNGPGFAPEVAERLFEPFFTTKPAGAGLGLGLAISAAIVREFGGTLRAGARPGGGAEFTIELIGAAPPPAHGATHE